MGLGMPEVVLILVIALIVFGPRKLPELGKSLGQAMTQFRKASEDFKRTWEQEVELDNSRKSTSTSASTSSSYDYNVPNDYHDPYHSTGSETDSSHQTAAATTEGHEGAQPADASHEAAKPETVAAAAGTNSTNAGSEPKKQHWI